MQNLYLQRYAWQNHKIHDKPNPNTKIIVVIPCFKEPNILDSLTSLFDCVSPDCQVEIICVVNYAEHEDRSIKAYNQSTAIHIGSWIKAHHKPVFSFYVIKAFDLPKKHAGVGLARKIGMDEAVRRFELLDTQDGIIVCFDADCNCRTNYLVEILKFYQRTPNTNAAIVYFEHPLEGKLQLAVYQGIINYELHLRYYKNILEYINHPACFHSVGSCITVSSTAYQKQGGMNKRKAGEDFYFIQKILTIGNVYNINTTTVFPSPRSSDRVPFGTGKAIEKMLKNNESTYYTYNPKGFEDIKQLLDKVPILYNTINTDAVLTGLPKSISAYLIEIDFLTGLKKIRNNSCSERQFLKSFYNWFNGFIVLKYIHFARDNFYKDVEILEAANWIINKLTSQKTTLQNKKMLLLKLRELDRLQ